MFEVKAPQTFLILSKFLYLSEPTLTREATAYFTQFLCAHSLEATSLFPTIRLRCAYMGTFAYFFFVDLWM